MSFGVTEKGFIPKRLSDVLESLQTKISNIVDPKTGEKPFVNESSDSVLGQFTSILAEEISVCWEQAYIAANQYDPQNSSGAALRGLVQLNGITASYGSSTEINITITGTKGTVIPKGSLIASADGSQVCQTSTSVTIPESGTINTTAVFVDKGPNKPEDNTIIAIQTPIYGWSGVTNTGIVSVGSKPDTDAQLHIKQSRATSNTSYRQVDAIYAGLINTPGVTFARVYVNKTNTVDARGIAAKTIAPVVVGGTNEDIAKVLSYKAGTLDNFQGNTDVTIAGKLGDEQVISFTRPNEVNIYVNMAISFTDTSLWPENGEELIKKAIVEYAEYNQEGTAGFAPGDDVILSRLYTPINSVLGFKVNSLKIGKTQDAISVNDIAIDWNQLAKFDTNNITITVEN